MTMTVTVPTQAEVAQHNNEGAPAMNQPTHAPVAAHAAQREVLADTAMPADYGLYEIPLARIRRNPRIDPRQHRNKARYERMRASFKAKGILQPITVRPVERSGDGADLEVVAGNTRFDGANEVGHTTIPALVRHIDAKEAAVLAGIENMERQDLSPVEEGIHAARLLSSLNNDHAEVMKVLGWSRTRLNSRIMLTHVTEAVQNALVQGDLKIGHVELLAGVPKDKQDKIAERIIEQNYSVVVTREKLARATRQLAKACFDLSDCNGCQYNSSTSADLFATSEDLGRSLCSNEQCWSDKTRQQLDIIVTDAKEDHGTVHLATSITDDSYVVLEETGENGVGKAQKANCASCEHYGAVVSETFGSEGKVRGGLCFNLECNAEKVTAYRNLTSAATTAGSATPQAQGGGSVSDTSDTTSNATASAASANAKDATAGDKPAGKSQAKPTKEQAPLTPATLKKGIKREAMTRFQQMGQDAIASHPRIGAAIALLNLYNMLNSGEYPEDVTNKAKAVLASLQGEAKTLPALNEATPDNGATLLARLPVEKLNEAMATLGSLTVWKQDPTEQYEKHPATKSARLYARTMKVDSTAYLAMTQGYMKAQVKAGLVKDCEQSGFADAYDTVKGEKAFSKLAKGKLSEIMAAIEALATFDWKGYEPVGFGLDFYDQ